MFGTQALSSGTNLVARDRFALCLGQGMFVVGCEEVKVYTSAMVLSRGCLSHLLDTREFPLEQQEKQKFHGKNHNSRTQRGEEG